MKTAMVLYLMLVAAVVANAQEERSWEEAFYDVMSNDGYDSDESAGTAMWEEALEWLSAMADSPLDINVASREELEQLPFLSAAQIDDIEEYHYRYGKMKSMNELYMIKSLDAARIELMKCFLVVKDEDKQQALRIKDLLAHSRQQLTAYCRVPFYPRRGDRNGYLGYKYKHWVQYDLTADNRVRAGLVGAQDAGEPFLSNSNKGGYDFYSYYFQVKNIGRVENAVVGKYRISAGMGLVLSNAFGLGKLATLQSLGRGTSALRPHSSRSSADSGNSQDSGRAEGNGIRIVPTIRRYAEQGRRSPDSFDFGLPPHADRAKQEEQHPCLCCRTETCGKAATAARGPERSLYPLRPPPAARHESHLPPQLPSRQ